MTDPDHYPPKYLKFGPVDWRLVAEVPEEWEAYCQGEEIGHARLLDESFRVTIPNQLGRQIYACTVDAKKTGYCLFWSQDSRRDFLRRATIAICAANEIAITEQE